MKQTRQIVTTGRSNRSRHHEYREHKKLSTTMREIGDVVFAFKEDDVDRSS